jgi:hypothetical protein
MASKVKALNHYRPQVEFEETVGWRAVAGFIAAQSTVSSVDMIAVLEGLHAAIVYFNGRGHGVRLEGLGTYLPNINYQGEFDVAHRLDRRLKKALNNGNFSGRIVNRKHIGKTVEEVVTLWNLEHPDDPVI